jgi:hypothetical protein
MDIFFFYSELNFAFISHFVNFPSFIPPLDGRCWGAKEGQAMPAR